MKQYLTELGKNKLRKMLYDVLVKKRDLRLKNIDMDSYEYQAIQQREIAVSILFDNLITWEEVGNDDKNMIFHYEHLVNSGKEPKKFVDNGIAWKDYLTVEGLEKLLNKYKQELIAKQASWYDGVFENLPQIDSITDVKQCTVNTNYLERQQGFVAIFQAFKIPRQKVTYIEDDVRNSIYTMYIEKNGAYNYKQLAHYQVNKNS